MTKGKKSRVRLTMDQRMRVLAYIARGDTISQVAAHVLEDFNIEISEATLYSIKRDNQETVSRMQERLADSAIADIDKLLHTSRTQLARKLSKANRDASELEQLDDLYRSGEIGKEEYQRRKTGLIDLSVSELATISGKLVAQKRSETSPEAPESTLALQHGHAPVLNGGSTPQQLEAMLNAIQSGSTVELQRIVFNPGGKQ